MKWFYEMYPDAYSNLPQAGVNLDQAIFYIPWGHNKLIIDKCKTDKDAYYRGNRTAIK